MSINTIPTPILHVIWTEADRWDGNYAMLTRLYAEALVGGALSPDEQDPVGTLARLHPEITAEHNLTAPDSDGWQAGVDFIQSLAHGRMVWDFDGEDLEQLGTSLEQLRTFFGGDIVAAARAFLERRMPPPAAPALPAAPAQAAPRYRSTRNEDGTVVLSVTMTVPMDAEDVAAKLYEAHAMAFQEGVPLPEDLTAADVMLTVAKLAADCAEGFHFWAVEPGQQAYDTVLPWARDEVRRLFPQLSWPS